MKLLRDENISRRIVPALQPAFPNACHVVFEGLQAASDEQVWQHAKAGGFVLVSKGDDFAALAGLRGQPPRLSSSRSAIAATTRCSMRCCASAR